MWICALFGCGAKDTFEVNPDPNAITAGNVSKIQSEPIPINHQIHSASETKMETVAAEVVETTPTPNLQHKLQPLPDKQQFGNEEMEI